MHKFFSYVEARIDRQLWLAFLPQSLRGLVQILMRPLYYRAFKHAWIGFPPGNNGK